MSHHDMLGCCDPEWARMWDHLWDKAGSPTDVNPESKEKWQYTGTIWKDRPAIGSLNPTRILVHEFRHRDRPKSARPIPGVARSDGRVVLHLLASWKYSGDWNHPLEEGSIQ